MNTPINLKIIEVKKRNAGKMDGGICVHSTDVSVYTLNITWMAITCQSAGDNDDFHSGFITSSKH